MRAQVAPLPCGQLRSRPVDVRDEHEKPSEIAAVLRVRTARRRSSLDNERSDQARDWEAEDVAEDLDLDVASAAQRLRATDRLERDAGRRGRQIGTRADMLRCEYVDDVGPSDEPVAQPVGRQLGDEACRFEPARGFSCRPDERTSMRASTSKVARPDAPPHSRFEDGDHLAADEHPGESGQEIGDLVRDAPVAFVRLVARDDDDAVRHHRAYRANSRLAASCARGSGSSERSSATTDGGATGRGGQSGASTGVTRSERFGCRLSCSLYARTSASKGRRPRRAPLWE